MSDMDAAVQAMAKALLDEGGAPGNNLHSWRCQLPERYGPCHCLEQTAEVVFDAARPYIEAAGVRRVSERLADLSREWESKRTPEPSTLYIAGMLSEWADIIESEAS